MIIGNNNDNVGVFANTNGDWRDSGEFDMSPGQFQDAWHHIVVVSDKVSNTTKFYLNGVYKGDSDRPTGNNISAIGNHTTGGQRFAEFLDDFRVYGVAITSFDVESIYREAAGSPLDIGEGDYTISTWFKPAANPGYMPGLTAGGLNGEHEFCTQSGKLGCEYRELRSYQWRRSTWTHRLRVQEQATMERQVDGRLHRPDL